MTTQTLTLAEFLLARYAEREAVAQAGSPGGWQFSTVDSIGGGALYDQTRVIANVEYEQLGDHDGRIVRHLLTPEANANGTHIAANDPAYVLDDIEAKRRIVELHPPWPLAPDCCETCDDIETVAAGYGQWPCATLKALALPYAGHPEFREEWRA